MSQENPRDRTKVILFANTDWYLYNFRKPLALELKRVGATLVLISPDTGYGRALTDLGLDWRPVPMDRGSLNPFLELGLLLHLWRFFRRERPDVVHGFTIKCAVYGAIASRLAGVRCRINAVAGMGFVFSNESTKAKLLRPVVRSLLRLALGGKRARLILQNPDDVALFRELGIVNPANIRMIAGSGVDCNRFAPRFTRERAGDKPRVLLAARLLWDKGFGEFADAARLLRNEGRNIHFLVAGQPDPGNPAAVPQATIHAWVAEGLFQWLGHVDDMPSLLASVDIMVLPSYREGLPKSLIEGAASSLPLVTTDVPGCREVVTHEVDGLLVPVKNAVALARAIARLVDDPALAQRLGAAARVRAVTSFDEGLVVERTIQVYEEVLRGSMPIGELRGVPMGGRALG